MSASGPFGDGDPFGGMPFLADLFKMLQSQGPVSWDTARQLAVTIATEGRTEPNVDPRQRMDLEQLGRVAELHVQQHTGLSTIVGGRPAAITPVNRTQWALRTIDAYRPVLERLASSLTRVSQEAMPDDFDTDDLSAEEQAAVGWMLPMLQLMGPMMLGLTSGSMVGHLATRAFGTYDLPVPRPGTHEVMIVVPNLDRFGDDWSVPRAELHLWVCLHELTHHAVLGLPHVGDRLLSLLGEHAGAFTSDPQVLSDRLGDIDIMGGPDAAQRLQEVMTDPDLVLGAVQSPQQRALLPHLEATVAAVVGYVDHVMDRIGTGLIPSYRMLTEALRRRRVEASPSDRFVERILGLNLTQAQYDRGHRFVAGVVERAGDDAVHRLWASERTLPTPAEIDAPGLWLARLELLDDE
jgi:putative hydrolase